MCTFFAGRSGFIEGALHYFITVMVHICISHNGYELLGKSILVFEVSLFTLTTCYLSKIPLDCYQRSAQEKCSLFIAFQRDLNLDLNVTIEQRLAVS